MVRRLGEVLGVERPQQGVPGHTQVEAVDEVDEELLPADPVVQRVHSVESRGRRLLADSRP